MAAQIAPNLTVMDIVKPNQARTISLIVTEEW
jgi:hypothetical protein